ncbi:MAG: glycoside hydrolase family 88 protein, partial [Promicromonosporaceae bacterium]|nr:glycoside hydrolase family 88 protein [Promicromonosporaceae bacterium]
SDTTASDDELEKIGVFKRDFGMEQWDWPQGVGLFGLSRAAPFLDEVDLDKYLSEWYQRRVEQGIPVQNINTTAPLLTLANYPFAADLANDWMDWVMTGATRTEQRGLQHDVTARDITKLTRNPQEIWVDTLIMTVLFVAKMGITQQNAEWINEAIYQTLLHLKYLYDPRTDLFFHGWSFIRKDNFGGVLWGRGNAWAAIGLPLLIDQLSDYLNPAVREHFLNYYRSQIAALVHRYLDPETNLWHTVLTNPNTYPETSGSAGILAAIYLGMRRGYLPIEEYLPVAERVLKAVLSKITDDGEVQGVSAGTPIQMTEQEYQDIVQAPMGYGQALTLLMLSFALEFYADRESNHHDH